MKTWEWEEGLLQKEVKEVNEGEEDDGPPMYPDVPANKYGPSRRSLLPPSTKVTYL